MDLIREPAGMRAWSRRVRSSGQTIGFVPTMGYLHEGHLSLMRIARKRSTRLVASIFVNPIQFGPNEDLDRYPRDEEGDLAKCAAEGCDAVFFPSPETMYPEGYQTKLDLGPLASGLCAKSRPGHMEGAATVVLKLFNLVLPDIAVFGEKDYQQLAIMRRMARDLDVPVDVVGGPIVRERDGVAMSSRNANLSARQREQAVALSQSLRVAEQAVADGERDAAALRARVVEHIARFDEAQLDYAELVDADTLQPVDALRRDTLLALAVRYGGTRLIDNRVLRPA